MMKVKSSPDRYRKKRYATYLNVENRAISLAVKMGSSMGEKEITHPTKKAPQLECLKDKMKALMKRKIFFWCTQGAGRVLAGAKGKSYRKDSAQARRRLHQPVVRHATSLSGIITIAMERKTD